jgi:hypothetical protein
MNQKNFWWVLAGNAGINRGIQYPAMDIVLSMGSCGKPAMNTAMDISYP